MHGVGHTRVMPKRSSKGQPRPRDPNQLAKFVVDLATGELDDVSTTDGKNPAAVALGRLGGKKGGRARAESLSAKRRREIARRAAKLRWAAKSE